MAARGRLQLGTRRVDQRDRLLQPARLKLPATKPVFICDGQTIKKYINTFSPFKLFRGRVLEEGDDFEI